MSYSESTGLLGTSGWSADRAIDASDQIGALRSEGYLVGVHLATLIANIAGIVLRFVRGGRPDAIRLDPAWASSLCFKSWVDHYSDRAGIPLVPVGYSNHEHLLLLVADDGRWFGGFDDEFGLLGSSIEEVVDAVVNDRAFREEL